MLSFHEPRGSGAGVPPAAGASRPRIRRGRDARYPFSVAQIANLLYRRLQIGRPFAGFRRPGQGAVLQDGILRYSAARRSRNQYDPTTDEHGWTRIRENPSSSVLIRVHPWLKKSSRAATISGDTDRLAVCATNTTEALNAYDAREDSRDGCPTVARPCSCSQCAQNMAWGLSMN